MMFFAHKHDIKNQYSVALRGLALFFAMLYVLSAVRGFVPEMCATQRVMAKRAAQETTQACTIESQTCCSKAIQHEGKTSEQDTPSPQTSCVFCSIATALVETPECYHFEVPFFVPAATPEIEPSILLSADTHDHIRNRAPPSHA